MRFNGRWNTAKQQFEGTLEVKQVTVNGAQLNVFDSEAGPPLLFVHGFPLNHTMWQFQAEAFGGTHRVIAPDLRGFGTSDVTEGTVTMEQFADDLNALLDALDVREPVCLCGLSMGGYIAWEFLRKYAGRLKSLILCDTRAEADTADVVQKRFELADAVTKRGSHVAADSMLPKLFAPETSDTNPEVVETVRRMIVDTSPQSIAAALRGMAERKAATDLLPEVRVPTLVVVGQEDRLTTVEEMREIAETIPGARFVEVLLAGHMSPMERPEEVNAAIGEFLAE